MHYVYTRHAIMINGIRTT